MPVTDVATSSNATCAVAQQQVPSGGDTNTGNEDVVPDGANTGVVVGEDNSSQGDVESLGSLGDLIDMADANWDNLDIAQWHEVLWEPEGGMFPAKLPLWFDFQQ